MIHSGLPLSIPESPVTSGPGFKELAIQMAKVCKVPRDDNLLCS